MDKKKLTQRKGGLYIAGEPLNKILQQRSNKKEVAYGVNTDYSNFCKSCKPKSGIQLRTYERNASALGFDVLLLHIPKGEIASLVPSTALDEDMCHLIADEYIPQLLGGLLRLLGGSKTEHLSPVQTNARGAKYISIEEVNQTLLQAIQEIKEKAERYGQDGTP